MKKQKIYAILLGLIIALSFTLPAQGSVEATYIKKLPYKFNAKPPSVGKPSKTTTSVKILNVPDGETVMGSVKVIVEAKGTFDHIDLDGSIMAVVYGDRYVGTWTASEPGPDLIVVVARDADERALASDSVEVQVVSDHQWEVFIEVDYIEGHKPSIDVLEYLVEYWSGFGVKVDYDISKIAVEYDSVITDEDFWAIEFDYNEGNDRAQDGIDADGYGYDEEYMSKEKWVLWGTWDENQYVGGYTYVVIANKDALAGNYVFIADAMIDDWESDDMTVDNGEIIVLCHELGHSIGILQLRGQSEMYDPDRYSIMSTMNVENALYMEENWYYSGSYWGTKNLSYYSVP
jgi:hypothetical protein